ncbi:MAG: hypothetical protein V1702_00830 [Candidatus Woesearchaeota archaeon]
MGVLGWLKPKKVEEREGRIYRSILAIRQDGKRTKAFDNAVKLLKNVLTKWGASIDIDNSITESPLFTILLIAKEFEIDKGNTEETVAWNLLKKTIQSFVQQDKKTYENIQVYNKIIYDFEPDEIIELPNLSRTLPIFKDISEDKLYVTYSFRIVTSDCDEILDIITSLNKTLRLPNVELKDAEKRYKDAIDQITHDISKKQNISQEKAKKIVKELANSGFVKAIYDRAIPYKVLNDVLSCGKNYLIEIASLCKSEGLKKLAPVRKEFVSRKISLGIALATEMEPLDQGGYFIIITDKSEIDPALMEMRTAEIVSKLPKNDK